MRITDQYKVAGTRATGFDGILDAGIIVGGPTASLHRSVRCRSPAARRFDIEVRHLPLIATHGAVWFLNTCWLIHLNSNDSLVRQRFTLYHEIFHVLAHSQGNPLFKHRGSDNINFNEILADHFSASMLIPQEMLPEYWMEYKDIELLADIFKVPKTVMYITLKAENLI